MMRSKPTEIKHFKHISAYFICIAWHLACCIRIDQNPKHVLLIPSKSIWIVSKTPNERMKKQLDNFTFAHLCSNHRTRTVVDISKKCRPLYFYIIYWTWVTEWDTFGFLFQAFQWQLNLKNEFPDFHVVAIEARTRLFHQIKPNCMTTNKWMFAAGQNTAPLS